MPVLTLGFLRQFAINLLRPFHFLFKKTITFCVAMYKGFLVRLASGIALSSKLPVREPAKKVYCLPNRLHYIASSLNINDVSEPMRIGQLPVFIKTSNPVGKIVWIGISSSQVFSPRSRGFFSPLIVDEDPSVMMGSKAYEVIVKQPVKEDYTTDRTEIVPTGRVLEKWSVGV